MRARTAQPFVGTAVVAAILVGCACGAPLTAVDDDGGIAATDGNGALADARGTDPTLDAHIAIDAAEGPLDAQADGGLPFDCTACPAPGPCESLTCDGACGYVVIPDGTACEDGVCVAGGCAARQCGDGWRERGDVEGFAREGCDDGNAASEDGCSASCAPEPLSIATNPGGARDATTLARPAAALDDDGRTLFTWTRERPDGEDALAVLATRFTRGGASIDADPVRLDTAFIGDRPDPTVIGLESGWLVCWSSRSIEGPMGSFDGVACSRVPATGPPSAPLQVNTTTDGTQRQPSVAPLASAIAVAWEHQSGGPPDVRGRLLSLDGVPLATELVVANEPHAEGGQAVASLGGDQWMVAWASAGSSPSARARVYALDTPQPTRVLVDRPVSQVALDGTGPRVIVGVVDPIEDGTVGVGTYSLDAPKTPSWTPIWAGSARQERDLAVARVGEGWLALYRSTAADGGDLGRVMVASSVAGPPEIETLRSALREANDVERFSITTLQDGWLFAWTARSLTGASEVRLLRLAP